MDKRITDLTQIQFSAITANDVLPIVNINTDETNKITIDQIKNYVNSGVTGTTGGFTYQIGQYVEEEGGVIFHSYKDGTNENYLVVSIDDQSTGTTWSNITDQLTGADSTWNGLENSLTITGQTGHTESAAQLCLEYVNGGCNTISVTYTLEGEPVTVEVESSGVARGKNYYLLTIGGDIYNIAWATSDVWRIRQEGLPFQAIFSEDTPCPFGFYTIEPGSIFEAFEVNPVNPIDDWYLPAIDELSLLWQNRFNVNRTLSGYSSFGSISGATQIGYNNYWSSTETAAYVAWYFSFGGGYASSSNKDSTFYVRAVRKFSI